MMAQQAGNSTGDILVPLPQWMENEDEKRLTSSLEILRKTTIAYGIAELFRHSRAYFVAVHSTLSIGGPYDAYNFAIRISQGVAINDIVGVDMLSPKLSVNIAEPPFLCSSDSDQGDDIVGRYLEANFTTHPDNGAASSIVMFSQSEEDARCHSLGALLYRIFSPHSPLLKRNITATTQGHSPLVNTNTDAPQEKKMRLLYSASNHFSTVPNPGAADGTCQTQTLPPQTTTSLLALGIPASMSLLVQNLIVCGDTNRPENAYDSLEGAIQDLHLVILDPYRFLFDNVPPLENGTMQLAFRKHKLYGREKEAASITDAFCRISGGKSEAFFIGGFSGSGKSRLVNNLTARIDVAEGYVVTHKFDQRSKKNQLMEVISMFNDLCLLVLEKRTHSEIEQVIMKLTDVFGPDLSVLVQLLPNIRALSPQLNDLVTEKEVGDNMNNLHAICFMLRRFMRCVSSSSHPVMLFLDDLQWSESSSLTVVEEILTGATGSSCVFFVGTYRNNEVPDDHFLFPFICNLTSSGVPTTKLSLEGLKPRDLNTLISDALCMFPRICEPLSDIVFHKTNGNPFFALSFLKSLVDDKLLEYSFPKRSWVWDEDHIGSMDITGNVLYLLTIKMNGLSEDVQLALKVAACFGTKTSDCLLRYLSATLEYANICNGLERVFSEGFMVKIGTSGWKFVHDKVREAAYSLIPDSEKNQFHFCIGMAIFTMTKGSDIEDIVFSVVDQINHGVSKVQSPELRCDLAELNEMAGIKAVKCSDYVTSRSYFTIALSLLPPNHWETHYGRSLRLYFLLAKSAYSCGDGTEANATLRHIISHACCLGDKLKSYLHLCVTLFDTLQLKESYTTASDVLSQLGEVIPDVIGDKEAKQILDTTSSMLSYTSEEHFLGTRDVNVMIADVCATQPTLGQATANIESILEFYNHIILLSFLYKPELAPVFVCRMAQLSMQHGVLKYTIMGFIQYSVIVCNSSSKVAAIQEACRIGKLAMSARKKFDWGRDLWHAVFCSYYCFVAPMTERLQLCADKLRKGFDSGIARGDRTYVLLNAVHDIRVSLHAGMELPTLLKQTEYYLGVVKRYSNTHVKMYLALFRDTILTLMGREFSSDIKEDELSVIPATTTNYHSAIRCYWMGHAERCHYFTEKIAGNKGGKHHNTVQHHKRFVMLYYGINSIKLIANSRKTTELMREIPKVALRTLKESLRISSCTFRNKVHLLEAEIFSYEGSNDEAKASYAAAIEAAQCSDFIHEQGIAWELSGVHYTKIGDQKNAQNSFTHAKHCYSKWGSQIKVDSIMRKMKHVQISSAPS